MSFKLLKLDVVRQLTLEVEADVDVLSSLRAFLKPCHNKIILTKHYRSGTVMAERKQGSVKWFNNTKGFGFISQANGEDVFVHFQSIIGDGYKSLQENDKVEFTLAQGPKGLQASEVKILK